MTTNTGNTSVSPGSEGDEQEPDLKRQKTEKKKDHADSDMSEEEHLSEYLELKQPQLFFGVRERRWRLRIRKLNGPVLLTGPPGSGKTALALWALWVLGKGHTVLTLTYTRTQGWHRSVFTVPKDATTVRVQAEKVDSSCLDVRSANYAAIVIDGLQNRDVAKVKVNTDQRVIATCSQGFRGRVHNPSPLIPVPSTDAPTHPSFQNHSLPYPSIVELALLLQWHEGTTATLVVKPEDIQLESKVVLSIVDANLRDLQKQLEEDVQEERSTNSSLTAAESFHARGTLQAGSAARQLLTAVTCTLERKDPVKEARVHPFQFWLDQGAKWSPEKYVGDPQSWGFPSEQAALERFEQLLERAQKVGLSPRYLLGEVDDFMNAVQQQLLETEALSSNLLFPFGRREAGASPFMLEMLAQNHLEHLYRCLPEDGAFRGKIYEHTFFSRLREGRIVTFKTEGGQEISFDKSWHVTQVEQMDNMENYQELACKSIFRPKSPVQGGYDAVVVDAQSDVFFLQFTVSPKHSLKVKYFVYTWCCMVLAAQHKLGFGGVLFVNPGRSVKAQWDPKENSWLSEDTVQWSLFD